MSAGLRRFAAPPARAGTLGTAAPGERPAPPAEPERCELCAVPLPAEHGHLVEVANRSLACACRACYRLFTADGAGGGSYRAVPNRYRYLPELPIGDLTWERLGIPVGLAFFFEHSELERTVAFYPSPAGATESQLDLGAWDEIAQAAPGLVDLVPDVEALLVNRATRRSDPDPAPSFEAYAVPIDACYRLVGLVRTRWRGFDGGEPAWQAIAAFLAGLRERSEPVRAGSGGG